MKTASIRAMQHQLAAMIAEVEKGTEIVITRRNQPVARLLPVAAEGTSGEGKAAEVRAYWRKRTLPPRIKSALSHAELLAEGRGGV
jgi:prevent-host-death family protein